MERRRFVAAVGTGVTLGLAGCLGLSSAGDYDVGMTASAFEPAEYTVEVGETVRWHNTSSRAHTVTAYEDALPDGAAFFASGGYDSEAAAREAWREDLGGGLTSGESYEHTFEASGVHDYFCVPHEQAGMVGRIVVEE